MNEDNGVAYEVGGEYVTRQRYRLPDLDLGSGRFNVCQMKHSGDTDGDLHGGFGGEPITSAPPLSLKRFGDNELELIERSGDYNGRRIWSQSFEAGRWFEITYQIGYDFDGYVKLWWRYDDEAPELVFDQDGIPTIKRNQQGRPMYSTYRAGLYGDPISTATFVDLGPVRVERLD